MTGLANLGDFCSAKAELLQLRFGHPGQIWAHNTVRPRLLRGKEAVSNR